MGRMCRMITGNVRAAVGVMQNRPGPVTVGAGQRRRGRAEERDERYTETRRDMHRSRIIGDHQRAASKERAQFLQRGGRTGRRQRWRHEANGDAAH